MLIKYRGGYGRYLTYEVMLTSHIVLWKDSFSNSIINKSLKYDRFYLHFHIINSQHNDAY